MWNKLLEQCHWRRFGTFICNIEQIPHIILVFKKLLNFMAPFYGWGSSASRLQPLRGGSLLFTIQLSTSEGWKAESTLEPPSGSLLTLNDQMPAETIANVILNMLKVNNKANRAKQINF